MAIISPELILGIVLKGLSYCLLLMLGFWIISVLIKNAGVVDIGWALGLVLLAWLNGNEGYGYPVRNAWILGMVGVWGLRLIYHLVVRLSRDRKEDPRYQRIRADWKTNVEFKFLGLFLLEAVLCVILAVPFLLIALNPRPYLWPVEWVGICVWAIGFCGEVIADQQLNAFRRAPPNKGLVCDVGLWKYSRHPNYFFEWVMWVGYFLFALASPWGWFAAVSPAVMYYLLRYVTGVPFAEAQSLQSRGERYQRYQQTTSIFFPLPKR